MTEKRFTLKHLDENGTNAIWIDETRALIPLSYEGILMIVDILNNLNDENKELKDSLKDCLESNKQYARENRRLIELCEEFNIDWHKALED